MAMNFQEVFVHHKEFTRRRTREVFALLRPENFEWRPVDGALSVGEMLRHLWVSEEGVRRVALQGDFSYYETRIPRGLFAVLGKPRTLLEEIADIERVHGETLDAVQAFPAEHLEMERSHEGLGYRRKVYVILSGIIEHEVHHRAQLMTYLRMLGRPAPEPMARQPQS
jgi:uncharacterized damage-inducible protein DinB